MEGAAAASSLQGSHAYAEMGEREERDGDGDGDGGGDG